MASDWARGSSLASQPQQEPSHTHELGESGVQYVYTHRGFLWGAGFWRVARANGSVLMPWRLLPGWEVHPADINRSPCAEPPSQQPDADAMMTQCQIMPEYVSQNKIDLSTWATVCYLHFTAEITQSTFCTCWVRETVEHSIYEGSHEAFAASFPSLWPLAFGSLGPLS